jgi:uncharacterized protein with PIN domain
MKQTIYLCDRCGRTVTKFSDLNSISVPLSVFQDPDQKEICTKCYDEYCSLMTKFMTEEASA